MLDAHIRKATNGKKSMDDVIRLEFKRWSGAHGYTAAEFNQTVSDAAGIDVGVATARAHRDDARDRLYGNARLVRSAILDRRRSGAHRWSLEVRPDATAEQREHFAALLRP